MTASQRALIGLMHLTPTNSMSRAVRHLVRIKSPVLVRRFALRYGIDLDEAEKPIEAYESILDLFTRRLRPGIRAIAPGASTLVCPVDGRFLSGGSVNADTLMQAKGRTYSLAALLAEDGAGPRFEGGYYATLYLSPKDYHRIHSPVAGRITGYTHVPGTLYPVNAAGVTYVGGLFARNERLITHIASKTFGRVEVVMVGATCVGHIRVAYDDAVSTNMGEQQVVRKTYDSPIPVERGGELGVFEMGSTVIVVAEKPLRPSPLHPEDPVQLGMALGMLA